MELEFKNENGSLTVKLIGKLDTMTAPKLEEELSKKINEVQEIIFDLETLKYISSSGIRVLLTIKKNSFSQFIFFDLDLYPVNLLM